MTRSGPTAVTPPLSTSKQKTRKVFYEHGKDSLELAVSIGKTQEDKALLKAEKHHQPQAGQPRSERTHQKSRTKKKLEEVKATIVSQRARLKREKVKMRKDRPARAVHQKSSPSSNAQDRAPRKRVSFA
ncbi:hypothetical protein DEU56DRAFT_742766 [Suillus clintonianus]|uniref:uncharacterized protein n=1 Tax=Suillus clintonianus TaxID=1904413 RepID=UPI001B86F01A|nr:uncharacterized protein DEU56DRAFT_742766 [Suillus clintonianus]KAG2126817.1 hypothetical protein DEU56DRAFT_742766 [Suillus clintonianus]